MFQADNLTPAPDTPAADECAHALSELPAPPKDPDAYYCGICAVPDLVTSRVMIGRDNDLVTIHRECGVHHRWHTIHRLGSVALPDLAPDPASQTSLVCQCPKSGTPPVSV